MNPIKIDTAFLAPLLLTGTTLLNRVLTQGVEQALLSAATEYGVKCIRLLPQCRHILTETIVSAFTPRVVLASLLFRAANVPAPADLLRRVFAAARVVPLLVVLTVTYVPALTLGAGAKPS